MAFINVAGTALHASMTGGAHLPVVAFANSLGADFRIWDEVAALLSQDFRLVFYDKRGHGLSDIGSEPVTIERHADDLEAVLAHFGVGRLALVGLSIGGLIAQRFAVRAPGRLAALVLCDTAAKIGNTENWNARIAAVRSGGLGSIADAVLETWFTPAYRVGSPQALQGWRNMLSRQPAPGYIASCAAIRDCDLSADAGKITAPALVVCGEHDRSTPPDLVRATAALIPGAKFALLVEASHIPCIEQPQALARLIQTHLKEAGHV